MVKQIHHAANSKESYPPRFLRLKLKLSCSKCCRFRYSMNEKGREADPFTDKLSLQRYRSRSKSESLSACSNKFGK